MHNFIDSISRDFHTQIKEDEVQIFDTKAFRKRFLESDDIFLIEIDD